MGVKIILCVFLFVFLSMADGIPTALKVGNICGASSTGYGPFYMSTQACYKVHTEGATWYEAHYTCAREGGHLAFINSQIEADIIIGQIPRDVGHFFVGFSFWREGLWLTDEGLTLAEAGYEKWHGEVPKGGAQHCGSMRSDGAFEDAFCLDRSAFICERNEKWDPTEVKKLEQETLRVTFVAYQPYQDEYSKRDSPQFQSFSKSLANAVNKIYEEQGRLKKISGTQRATLVRIQSRTSDDFSCKVTLDIGTTGYCDMDKIAEILRNHIQMRRSLGDVVVSNTDFSATVVDPDATKTKESEVWYEPSTSTEAETENTTSDDATTTEESEVWYEPSTSTEAETENTTSDDATTTEESEVWYEPSTSTEAETENTTSDDATTTEESEVWYEPSTSTEAETENTTSDDATTEETYETTMEPSTSTEAQTETVTKPQLTCGHPDTGYTLYENVRACYKFYPEPASWHTARDICHREGADLVVVNNRAEAQILTKIVPFSGKNELYYRVALGFRRHGGSWKTIDGQSLSEAGYEYWADGEPNNAGEGQDCGAMYGDGNFDDIECDKHFRFVCEKQPDATTTKKSEVWYEPSTSTEAETESITSDDGATTEQDLSSTEPALANKCDDDYVHFGNTRSCYKIHRRRAVWYSAFATCLREGAHLAIINDREEAAAISRHFPYFTNRLWLGFGFWKNKTWLTIQGQTIEEAGYSAWARGEPDNDGGNQFCGCMFFNGLLDDLSCNSAKAFICEKELS